MPRILGVDIPNNKKLAYSLRYIYGIGPKRADIILEQTGLDPDMRAKDLDEEQIIQVLQYSIWRLEGLKDWNREEILSACNFVSIMMDLKLKIFLGPVFMALSGSVVSISVMDSMCLLGREMSLARLRHALELMGGVGKKKQKKLEKTFNDAISSA